MIKSPPLFNFDEYCRYMQENVWTNKEFIPYRETDKPKSYPLIVLKATIYVGVYSLQNIYLDDFIKQEG